MKKDTSWGKVAEWYDDVVKDENSYQNKVILPNLTRIVKPETGKEILDLACGQGFFSHVFASKGARVVGVDIGPELIDIAKKEATHKEEFYVAPADNLSFIQGPRFDGAVSVLAIQNIENISKTFKEVGRVLKKGGVFVMVLNHPAFRIPGHSAWGFDDSSSTQYRSVDEYLSESRKIMDMAPSKPGTKTTVSFHRPLQVYSKSLANAGFAIARIEEWVSHKESESGPRKKAEDKARKEIPMFMCLECIKL